MVLLAGFTFYLELIRFEIIPMKVINSLLRFFFYRGAIVKAHSLKRLPLLHYIASAPLSMIS